MLHGRALVSLLLALWAAACISATAGLLIPCVGIAVPNTTQIVNVSTLNSTTQGSSWLLANCTLTNVSLVFLFESDAALLLEQVTVLGGYVAIGARSDGSLVNASVTARSSTLRCGDGPCLGLVVASVAATSPAPVPPYAALTLIRNVTIAVIDSRIESRPVTPGVPANAVGLVATSALLNVTGLTLSSVRSNVSAFATATFANDTDTAVVALGVASVSRSSVGGNASRLHSVTITAHESALEASFIVAASGSSDSGGPVGPAIAAGGVSVTDTPLLSPSRADWTLVDVSIDVAASSCRAWLATNTTAASSVTAAGTVSAAGVASCGAASFTVRGLRVSAQESALEVTSAASTSGLVAAVGGISVDSARDGDGFLADGVTLRHRRCGVVASLGNASGPVCAAAGVAASSESTSSSATFTALSIATTDTTGAVTIAAGGSNAVATFGGVAIDDVWSVEVTSADIVATGVDARVALSAAGILGVAVAAGPGGVAVGRISSAASDVVLDSVTVLITGASNVSVTVNGTELGNAVAVVAAVGVMRLPVATVGVNNSRFEMLQRSAATVDCASDTLAACGVVSVVSGTGDGTVEVTASNFSCADSTASVAVDADTSGVAAFVGVGVAQMSAVTVKQVVATANRCSANVSITGGSDGTAQQHASAAVGISAAVAGTIQTFAQVDLKRGFSAQAAGVAFVVNQSSFTVIGSLLSVRSNGASAAVAACVGSFEARSSRATVWWSSFSSTDSALYVVANASSHAAAAVAGIALGFLGIVQVDVDQVSLSLAATSAPVRAEATSEGGSASAAVGGVAMGRMYTAYGPGAVSIAALTATISLDSAVSVRATAGSAMETGCSAALGGVAFAPAPSDTQVNLEVSDSTFTVRCGAACDVLATTLWKVAAATVGGIAATELYGFDAQSATFAIVDSPSAVVATRLCGYCHNTPAAAAAAGGTAIVLFSPPQVSSSVSRGFAAQRGYGYHAALTGVTCMAVNSNITIDSQTANPAGQLYTAAVTVGGIALSLSGNDDYPTVALGGLEFVANDTVTAIVATRLARAAASVAGLALAGWYRNMYIAGVTATATNVRCSVRAAGQQDALSNDFVAGPHAVALLGGVAVSMQFGLDLANHVARVTNCHVDVVADYGESIVAAVAGFAGASQGDDGPGNCAMDAASFIVINTTIIASLVADTGHVLYAVAGYAFAGDYLNTTDVTAAAQSVHLTADLLATQSYVAAAVVGIAVASAQQAMGFLRTTLTVDDSTLNTAAVASAAYTADIAVGSITASNAAGAVEVYTLTAIARNVTVGANTTLSVSPQDSGNANIGVVAVAIGSTSLLTGGTSPLPLIINNASFTAERLTAVGDVTSESYRAAVAVCGVAASGMFDHTLQNVSATVSQSSVVKASVALMPSQLAAGSFVAIGGVAAMPVPYAIETLPMITAEDLRLRVTGTDVFVDVYPGLDDAFAGSNYSAIAVASIAVSIATSTAAIQVRGLTTAVVANSNITVTAAAWNAVAFAVASIVSSSDSYSTSVSVSMQDVTFSVADTNVTTALTAGASTASAVGALAANHAGEMVVSSLVATVTDVTLTCSTLGPSSAVAVAGAAAGRLGYAEMAVLSLTCDRLAATVVVVDAEDTIAVAVSGVAASSGTDTATVTATTGWVTGSRIRVAVALPPPAAAMTWSPTSAVAVAGACVATTTACLVLRDSSFTVSGGGSTSVAVASESAGSIACAAAIGGVGLGSVMEPPQPLSARTTMRRLLGSCMPAVTNVSLAVSGIRDLLVNATCGGDTAAATAGIAFGTLGGADIANCSFMSWGLTATVLATSTTGAASAVIAGIAAGDVSSSGVGGGPIAFQDVTRIAIRDTVGEAHAVSSGAFAAATVGGVAVASGPPLATGAAAAIDLRVRGMSSLTANATAPATPTRRAFASVLTASVAQPSGDVGMARTADLIGRVAFNACANGGTIALDSYANCSDAGGAAGGCCGGIHFATESSSPSSSMSSSPASSVSSQVTVTPSVSSSGSNRLPATHSKSRLTTASRSVLKHNVATHTTTITRAAVRPRGPSGTSTPSYSVSRHIADLRPQPAPFTPSLSFSSSDIRTTTQVLPNRVRTTTARPRRQTTATLLVPLLPTGAPRGGGGDSISPTQSTTIAQLPAFAPDPIIKEEATRQTTQVVVVATATAGTMMAAPSDAIQAQRTLVVLALTQCRAEYDGAFPFPQSLWPGFGIDVGARGAYMRGAALAGVVSLISVAVLGLLVTLVLHATRSDAKRAYPISAACSRIRFPAQPMSIAWGFALTGMVMLAVGAAVHGHSRGLDIFLLLLVLFITGVYIAAVAYICRVVPEYASEFRADNDDECVPDDKWRSFDRLFLGPMTWHAKKPRARNTADEQRDSELGLALIPVNVGGSIQYQVPTRNVEMMTANGAAPRWLVSAFMPLVAFDCFGSCYRRNRPGYALYNYVFDLAITTLSAVVAGTMPTSWQGCLNAMILMTLLCSVHLAIQVVLRPQASPIKNILALWCSALTFFGALIGTAGFASHSNDALSAAQVFVMIAAYSYLVSIAVSAITMTRAHFKKKAFRAKMSAEAAASLLVPPETIAVGRNFHDAVRHLADAAPEDLKDRDEDALLLDLLGSSSPPAADANQASQTAAKPTVLDPEVEPLVLSLRPTRWAGGVGDSLQMYSNGVADPDPAARPAVVPSRNRGDVDSMLDDLLA